MSPEKPASNGAALKPFMIIVPLFLVALICVTALRPWRWQVLDPTPVPPTSLPTVLPSPTLIAVASRQATPTKASIRLVPTPTNTRVVVTPTRPTPTAVPATPTPTKEQVLAQLNESLIRQIRGRAAKHMSPMLSYSWDSHLALAHYFAWYGGQGWDDCNISAGDKPLEPYDSADPAAIARHIQMAYEIGLNGFLLHWFGPGNPTDQNFKSLLQLSQGLDFASSVVFSYHIRYGVPEEPAGIAEALRYAIQIHGVQPNFLRVEGKPVIFFTDVYRTPATGQSPQQFWATMRDQVDPDRESWWIAEGLDASYLSVFDGLYVFKVSHADYPRDYLKSARWATKVRAMAQQVDQPKLWLATIGPGWDDLRSGCKQDVRVPNKAHRLDRAGGEVYRENFAAAMDSQPDWLLIGSFNEWVEGTYIEPSVQYGDQYMRLTEEFIKQFKEESNNQQGDNP